MSRSPASLFVRPMEGRTVRKPNGLLLALEGETVAASTYWSRRLVDEDVTTDPLPKARKPAAEAKD